MVTVAQLVEPRTVTPVVAGSNPVGHPTIPSKAVNTLACCGMLNTVRSSPGPKFMPSDKVKTVDGARTTLAELNTAVPTIIDHGQRGLLGRLAGAYRKLSLVMAGMYTGLSCGGTPNTHHSYEAEPSAEKPDKRPL